MEDERIAALEEQMANKELQWEQEKEKILKALKAERVIRRKAEAEKKAMIKEPLKVFGILRRGASPAEEVQCSQNLQNPSTELQNLTKQVKELASDNAALKKQISTKELTWEEEKGKILGALKKERLLRRGAEAGKRAIAKKWQDE